MGEPRACRNVWGSDDNKRPHTTEMIQMALLLGMLSETALTRGEGAFSSKTLGELLDRARSWNGGSAVVVACRGLPELLAGTTKRPVVGSKTLHAKGKRTTRGTEKETKLTY